MKIVGGKIYALQMPFVEAFAHSTKSRKFSDSFVVRLVTDDGCIGYGEGVARPYVTGESVARSVEHIKTRLFPAVAMCDFQEISAPSDALEMLAAISENLPEEKFAGSVIFNAARAAVEIALLDCLLKRQKLSLSTILPPKRDAVIYSGVITSGKMETALQHARRFKLFGIKQIKIKVGFDDDAARVAAIREITGGETSLRLDANGAFDVKTAVALAEKLSKFKIDAFEQPIPRGAAKDFARVKTDSPIPVMADESLVTLADARELIEFSACDFFNLRVSKCGGIYNTLRLALLAKEAGIRLQIGCQVGETAILSAAARHVAAFLETPEFVEGSYGNLLLIEDVARNSVNFGHGGRAPVLRGAGFGIEVQENTLKKYARRIINLGKESAKYA